MSCEHNFQWLDQFAGYYCTKCGIEDNQAVLDDLFKDKPNRPIIILTMRALGLTYREIGERLGLTRQACQQIEARYIK